MGNTCFLNFSVILIFLNTRVKLKLMQNTPLSNLRPGETGIVVQIAGGHGVRQKLALRGIKEGSWLRVISSRGPVVVESNGGQIAVGRGMAQKIIVEVIG